MDDRAHPSSTGSLISEALGHLSGLVRKEFDLARAEIDQNLKRAGIALGLLVAAVVVALTALNTLAGALVAAIVELGVEPGWSALIVGVIFGGIAWGLMAKGLNDLKLSSLAPKRTTENVKRDAQAIKGAVENG